MRDRQHPEIRKREAGHRGLEAERRRAELVLHEVRRMGDVKDAAAGFYRKHEARVRGSILRHRGAGAVSYTHLDVYKRQKKWFRSSTVRLSDWRSCRTATSDSAARARLISDSPFRHAAG